MCSPRSGCTSTRARPEPLSSQETPIRAPSTSSLATRLFSRTILVNQNVRLSFAANLTCCTGHYIENTSETQNLTFIEIYKAERVADVSLTQWLALTPADIVADVLKVPIDIVLGLKKEKQVLVHGRGRF